MTIESMLNLNVMINSNVLTEDLKVRTAGVRPNSYFPHMRSRNDSGGSAASSLSSSGSCSPPNPATANLAQYSTGQLFQPQQVYSQDGQSSQGSLSPASLSGGAAPQHPMQIALGSRRLLDRSISEPVSALSDRLQQQQQQQQQQQPLGQQQQQLKTNANRYKTEMCRPFEENGYCKYGNKCQFAHGVHELRSVNRHPKYKTEMCRTYHTIGFCPYGPRCHFIHNEDERKMNYIVQMKQQQQQVVVQAATAQQVAQQQVQQQRLASPPSPPTQSSVGISRWNSVPCQQQQQQQQQQTSFSLIRPNSLSFSLSLGSAASSITESPIPSPTSSLGEQDPSAAAAAFSVHSTRLGPPPGFGATTPPVTAPAALSAAASAFSFPTVCGDALPPMSVHPEGPPSSTPSPVGRCELDPLAQLALELQAARVSPYDKDVQEANQLLRDLFKTAHTPAVVNPPTAAPAGVESAESRLPIFSQISLEA